VTTLQRLEVVVALLDIPKQLQTGYTTSRHEEVLTFLARMNLDIQGYDEANRF